MSGGLDILSLSLKSGFIASEGTGAIGLVQGRYEYSRKISSDFLEVISRGELVAISKSVGEWVFEDHFVSYLLCRKATFPLPSHCYDHMPCYGSQEQFFIYLFTDVDVHYFLKEALLTDLPPYENLETHSSPQSLQLHFQN